MAQGFLNMLPFCCNSHHCDHPRTRPKGAHDHIPLRHRTRLALLTGTAAASLPPHSCCSNDENVCNLIFNPCTPARPFLSPIAKQLGQRGSLALGRAQHPLAGSLVQWIASSSLGFQKAALLSCPCYCKALSSPVPNAA